jgi:NAD(P) transhydrogenase subunit beta
MPGHLNVILSEAGVEYDDLLSDIEAANSALASADVALIVGANDIVNPAAEDDPRSPIYGMPILQAYKAKQVVVIKRGKGTGFAGIDNPLFYKPNTVMLYGDARTVAKALLEQVRSMEGAAHFH